MIVIWSQEASKSLSEIYNYIFEDSPQNADKVLNKIIDLVESLQDERYEYSIDPIINKEKFRHISIWSYKIIYERTNEKVLILDIFNGKQNPDKLKKF
ncbi:plasmid stabilization system protein ParE [Flavobacterium sp. CG_9.1]|uniref:Type II toxin-antitoxin system RelE/ParE family toxin n=2 Tax=Flavobacterium TaxID=237 RepID=A0A4R5CNS9_9FLAO|nr:MULTISPECIES: type II toxin-antitoxin system RelE/ParE family toxin [Flavobacterium]MBG6060512.1 plasmid stabilization system protein ParE [Flavobacterium sp. CG_9.1]TDE02082.1 type II toxin-antitoxin system RelE/ParE family toxin [Flavobacterium sandaracinum]SHL55452.1 Plasmid stabilization system protein ParE [Flavobacterium xanthum]